VFAISSSWVAQSSEPAEVQALPAWAADGKIPSDESAHFIFHDSRTARLSFPMWPEFRTPFTTTNIASQMARPPSRPL